MPRPAAYISEIAAAGSASRRSCALGYRLLHAWQPCLVTWRAAHISDMLQAPSLSGMKANLALSACEPTAACRRRRRSLSKVSRSLLQPLVLAPRPAEVLRHLEGVVPCRRLRGVGPHDPARRAPRVDPELAGGLRVGAAALPAQPHRLLLEPCRILGRRTSRPMPPFPVYGIMPKRNSMCQRKRGRIRFKAAATGTAVNHFS